MGVAQTTVIHPRVGVTFVVFSTWGSLPRQTPNGQDWTTLVTGDGRFTFGSTTNGQVFILGKGGVF